MEHMKAETLARLVEDDPSARETEHLESCGHCRSELAAYLDQTEALRGLPEIVPPLGDWEVLEARLRSDGLLRDPGLVARMGFARTPSWMRAAAAFLLFMAGGASGAALASGGAFGAPGVADADPTLYAQAATLDAAATVVQAAEQNYVAALTRYRQLITEEGGDEVMSAASRYAALEYLLAAHQAAVRQAPGDPVLNGLFATTLAERNAMRTRMASRTDNWF